MGSARSERRRVAVTADSIATRTVVTREVRTEEKGVTVDHFRRRRLRWDRGPKTRAGTTPALQTG